MVKCEVRGCSNKQGVGDVTLHRFPPVDSSLCAEWYRKCGAKPINEMSTMKNREFAVLIFYKMTIL